jgi:hypothetical protein
LIVAYHQPALMLVLFAFIVRRVGEPIRTVLTPHQMRRLPARHGFSVRWDRELPAIASELSAEIGRKTRLMRHLRIVIADRKGRQDDMIGMCDICRAVFLDFRSPCRRKQESRSSEMNWDCSSLRAVEP